MSLSHAMPLASQENPTDQLTGEEKDTLFNYLQVLVDHLNCCGISTTAPSEGSTGKLSKLSVIHLMELASDMCDELNRREMGSIAPLLSKPELTTKRNNARIRMAEFNSDKLNNLILDVVQEIDRRDISPPNRKSIPEDVKKRRTSNSFESSCATEKSPINLKKSKAVESELRSNNSFISIQEEKSNVSFNAGMCSGIDSLNAMIEDLGSLIDNGGDEKIDEMKQKYENEISNLREMIKKYEKSIIPEKNREISKLMAKIEESELINDRLRKELSSLNDKLSCQEIIIQDQKLAYESVKAALDSIHDQISNRAVNADEASFSAARIELMSSHVFPDLNNLNGQIVSAICEIEHCISNFNQKIFLKLLREIATAAKSFIIAFEKVLQVSRPLNVLDLCEEGERLKSEYIDALASVLVAGKDFSARPEHCLDVRPFIENFRSANNSLFDLKSQFEAIIQKN